MKKNIREVFPPALLKAVDVTFCTCGQPSTHCYGGFGWCDYCWDFVKPLVEAIEKRFESDVKGGEK